MRRRLHRRGLRGEPLTLLVDDRYPGETLEALVRGIYRYRSELAPLVLGATTGLTAALLHAWVPEWAPIVAVLAVAGSAALWWMERLTSCLRTIERAYAAAVTGAAGLWLAAGTALGPGTGMLPALLVFGTLAGAVVGAELVIHVMRPGHIGGSVRRVCRDDGGGGGVVTWAGGVV
jgi:hypothetical protein